MDEVSSRELEEVALIEMCIGYHVECMVSNVYCSHTTRVYMHPTLAGHEPRTDEI